ncbi:MAG TPA: o-succinylbenzoate synthase, partial [Blastocatellia bacterium]|nr:o-succinylbenzoate synthase [Blastocatellia bacterium]
RLELREIALPLKWPFETSFGRTTRRRIMIVRVFDKSGAFGYGECTAPEDPFYNHETVDTAWLIAARYVAPLLAGTRVGSAREVNDALMRIRGNRMAKGGVEAAIWDLEARLAGKPLWQHIGGTREEIACGVSIGLQESVDALVGKVAHEVERGYQRIKIKIKPGRDVDLVEAIRAKFPKITLTVDANSAYTLADIDLLRQLDKYNLMMIEQPLAPGDLLDHSVLQKEISTPLCLDESILTVADARHADALGSCKIINVKLGRVGGHCEARMIQDYCARRGIPVWCGGMLESGVGRAHNIAMSTLEGFTLPGDVSASERYWEEDIIDPPVTVSPQGTITAPMGAGIGYEVNEARLESLVERREEIGLR